MNNVAVLEPDVGERPANLGAQFDLFHGRELAKKLEPLVHVLLQWLTDADARQCRRSRVNRGLVEQSRSGHSGGGYEQNQGGDTGVETNSVLSSFLWVSCLDCCFRVCVTHCFTVWLALMSVVHFFRRNTHQQNG